MRNIEVIALTPAGQCDPAIAIAASRAGAWGFLDLEFCRDRIVAQSALDRLTRFTSGAIGVKLAGDSGIAHALLMDQRTTRPMRVIIAGGIEASTPTLIAQCRERDWAVLIEATTVEEAIASRQFGCDGIILKGNEAGGRVGPEASFILIQRWLRCVRTDGGEMPFWVQGGVGLHTAAACAVAGAAGVVLDAQLLLTRESAVTDDVRTRLASFDGSETICRGEAISDAYRFYARPGLPAVDNLKQHEDCILTGSALHRERRALWRAAMCRTVGADPDSEIWLIGQDATLARPYAQRFHTVSGVIQAIQRSVRDNCQSAQSLQPLARDSVLAQQHGTRYPIVQGPMTRVSDTPAFAAAVAEAGGLPFLALALLRQAETNQILQETKKRLGDRPWGAGILGFAPPEIRNEQIEAVRRMKPSFALIAGGRPDQANELEKDGIATYLHVPSPGLLQMFLRSGARRFVFEGRECGGHVGPRSSFVLWESMCDLILEQLGQGRRGDHLQVLFAGGIHDSVSAAMVAALSAPLCARGVAIGVLIGTAYLFTQEAVQTGAIVEQYQNEALNCRDTVLLETGPGHAIRCVRTPYAEAFADEKKRLQIEGRDPDEIREALEALNVGRLRIATKGLDRATVDKETANAKSAFVRVEPKEQLQRGMYMIGQVACLRDKVVSMAELHEDICTGSGRILGAGHTIAAAPKQQGQPSDIAIIGMACFFPKAGGLDAYWKNILGRVDAITEVPADHWDWRLYYDADPKARDKISSKWGGFLDDVPFDPLKYGIPPNSLTTIEPVQLLLLEAVRQALADAGYSERPFDRERTAVVLGAGGGSAQLSMAFGFRSYLPLLETVPGLRDRAAEILKRADSYLPNWSEDSFPGILVNVAAGRVANRFNFGGPNFAIDAACGSSLAALYAGVRELEMGTSDLAVVMGADTVQNPVTYMAFSKTKAFSPRGRCSTFDEAADGIVISEGAAVVILKRLADAERDGDRVYAVIKGVGASSDGKDKGLTAPRPEGQLRALRRAYAKAGVSPANVGFVEAHGTGTVVGDQTEVQSLGQVFGEAGARPRNCIIGSVKSLIGHTKCAAGLAGLINAVLALHHKILPPLLVDRPNSRANFEKSPFFLNTEPRPWVHGSNSLRCAGVSAFGFGGTNFHTVLQEYTGDFLERSTAGFKDWPAELFVFRRASRRDLIAALRSCRDALANRAHPRLAELALSLWNANAGASAAPSVALIASSYDDLREKLSQSLALLEEDPERIEDPRGIYFAASSAGPIDFETGKLAFLFPGQGSQYPNMLAQLAMAFPEVRAAFDEAERTLADRLDQPLGRLLFPPSTFTTEQEEEQRQALMRTEAAQPAIGAACVGMFRLLKSLGIEAAFHAGHSYGDFAALAAAGALSYSELIDLSYNRGIVIAEAAKHSPGAMAAIDADGKSVARLIADFAGVSAANWNGPRQTVISGTVAGVEAALVSLQKQGVRGQRLSVACAFHSPLIESARSAFAGVLARYAIGAPNRIVFANSTGATYPNEPEALRKLLTDHLVSPVRFQQEIEGLYAAGARVFVEVGPQAVLTNLVGQILAGKPHVAVASDSKGRPGLVQLNHLIGRLFVAGVGIHYARLFAGRGVRSLDLAGVLRNSGAAEFSATTWLVNSTRARPVNGPEPKLLGQARSESETMQIDNLTRAEPKRLKSPPQSSGGGIGAPKPTAIPPQGNSVAGANGHTPLPHACGNDDEAGIVMQRFQDVMTRFLETQRSVMLTYLQGGGVPAPTSLPAQGNGKPAHHSTSNGQPYANGNGNGQPYANGNGPAASQPGNAAKPAVEPPATAPVLSAPKPNAIEKPSDTPDSSLHEQLSAKLLEIVRQRTGYPTEMLGLDLDLEADLGIDSIKRVEILGTLADSNLCTAHGLSFEMEKLTGIKTLRGILDYVSQSQNATSMSPAVLASQPESSDDSAVKLMSRAKHTSNDGIQRMTVHAVDIAQPLAEAIALPGGTIVISDDGRGVARALTNRLSALGQNAVAIGVGDHNGDLTDPDVIHDLIRRLRTEVGPLTGIIHLAPLAIPPSGESWRRRMEREVQSLFLLAHELAHDLRQGEKRRPALFIAATSMGGSFGLGEQTESDALFPGQGGVAGLMKSLAHEWPDVLVRVLDFERTLDVQDIAAKVISELGDFEGPVEIGHQERRRLTLQCRPAPLSVPQDAQYLVLPDSTVLLTGGARGITAAVGIELARRFQPTLVLIGRSALPDESEAVETASLTGSAEMKAAVIARMRREGRPTTPAVVEAAYQRLLHDREIRANVAQMRQAGARVHYFQADVRDETALTAVLEEVHQRIGAIDGVIHGAGVIQDKLIQDKTPESYQRVFGTKVDSALILTRRLRFENLKFCVFFASVAGRFGNRGQADYAAANEVLTKLAIYLDRRWPGRFASLVWGPWSTIGMVSELEQHLGERGLQMIPPEIGPKFLVDELLQDRKGDCEVVIAGNVGQLACSRRGLASHTPTAP